MAVIARNCAACPEEVATATAPPSKAATRASKTSYRNLITWILSMPERTNHRGVTDSRVDVSKLSDRLGS